MVGKVTMGAMKTAAMKTGAVKPTGDTAAAPARQYSAPRYYEIAFDMNRKQEVDFLVHCFRTYARRPVKTVLDIACGTGPHLIRLGERGYRMSGLDLSPENIEFLRERAAGKGLDVELLVARHDALPAAPARRRGHLHAGLPGASADQRGHPGPSALRGAGAPAGRALRLRPLHVLVVDGSRRGAGRGRAGGARPPIRATFEALVELNPVTQTFYEDMELEVLEDGARRVYRQRHASRMVFPQELRCLVELAGGFDLCEWFYGFKPRLRLDEAHHPLLMVVALRKK